METEQLPVVRDPHCPFAPVELISSRATPQTYSVPRRYDLATLMAVMMAYACLFGAMRALGAGPQIVVWIAGFLTFVGAAQAILFKGRRPRTASMIAGIPLGFLLLAVEGRFGGWRIASVGELLFRLIFLCSCVGVGAQLGYLGGVVVAGVFLVAHYLRRAAGCLAR